MTEHTQLIDAVNIRTAVRTYDDEPIDDDTARQLEMALQPINLLGDLNIQLVRNQPKVFEANASGHLTNAANYLAIVGPKNDEEARERAGFYAERLVLTATLRGLGTLWVAGSWDKDEAAPSTAVWHPVRSSISVWSSAIPRTIWSIGRNPMKISARPSARTGRPNRMSSSPPRWAMKNVTQHQRGSRPASRLR